MAHFQTSPQAYSLWWIAAGGQSSLPMGEFPTREAAEAAIPDARAELLGQCGEDEQRARIEAGTFSVDAPAE